MEIVPYTTSGNVKEMCKFHEHWKYTETWNFCTFTVDFQIPEMQLFFLCRLIAKVKFSSLGNLFHNSVGKSLHWYVITMMPK